MPASSDALTSVSEPAVPAKPRHPSRHTLRRALAALGREVWPTAKYLSQTEVHTYAFSVAANAILSFFPFCVLLLTLTRHVFHSPAMANGLIQLLSALLPANQPFITHNISVLVEAHKGVQVLSMFMLLVSSTGVFLPLEVALNRVWGFERNRSYRGNQIISLLLALACGVLALLSAALTGFHRRGPELLFLTDGAGRVGKVLLFLTSLISTVVVTALATMAIIAIFFLIYWRLPNGKVAARRVLPAAVLTGIIWQIGKAVYMRVLPHLNFPEAYGPFYVSVTLIFWAFLSGMLLLAGARLSAALRLEEPA